MRRKRPRPVDLRPTYSAEQYLVAGLLCVAALVATLAAVVYPAAVLAALLVAGATVTARALVRAARTDRSRKRGAASRRQHDAKPRRICVPATDICLEA